MFGTILTAVIFGIVAFIMIGIGILQIKSVEPVGFYTGEKPPASEELTDVKSWNIKHGIMWIAYGAIIIISWYICSLMGDSVYSVLILSIGVVLPLIFMVLYHHSLLKKYKKTY